MKTSLLFGTIQDFHSTILSLAHLLACSLKFTWTFDVQYEQVIRLWCCSWNFLHRRTMSHYLFEVLQRMQARFNSTGFPSWHLLRVFSSLTADGTSHFARPLKSYAMLLMIAHACSRHFRRKNFSNIIASLRKMRKIYRKR